MVQKGEGDLLKIALLCLVDIKNQIQFSSSACDFFPPDPLLLGVGELSSGSTDSVCGCNTKTR